MALSSHWMPNVIANDGFFLKVPSFREDDAKNDAKGYMPFQGKSSSQHPLLEGSSLTHLVMIPNEQSQDGASCQPLQQGD